MDMDMHIEVGKLEYKHADTSTVEDTRRNRRNI